MHRGRFSVLFALPRASLFRTQRTVPCVFKEPSPVFSDGAKYVIKNGTYIPERNAFIRFIGMEGKANYALVGMKTGGRVATYHVESVMSMAKSGVSLFLD